MTAASPSELRRDLPATLEPEALRKDWEALRDTHDFHNLLKTHGVDREQAFQVVGNEFAQPIATDAVRLALEAARDQEYPIMVFTGVKSTARSAAPFRPPAVGQVVASLRVSRC